MIPGDSELNRPRRLRLTDSLVSGAEQLFVSHVADELEIRKFSFEACTTSVMLESEKMKRMSGFHGCSSQNVGHNRTIVHTWIRSSERVKHFATPISFFELI